MALEAIEIAQARGEAAGTEDLTRLVHAQARLMESLKLTPRSRSERPEDGDSLAAYRECVGFDP